MLREPYRRVYTFHFQGWWGRRRRGGGMTDAAETTARMRGPKTPPTAANRQGHRHSDRVSEEAELSIVSYVDAYNCIKTGATR